MFLSNIFLTYWILLLPFLVNGNVPVGYGGHCELDDVSDKFCAARQKICNSLEDDFDKTGVQCSKDAFLACNWDETCGCFSSSTTMLDLVWDPETKKCVVPERHLCTKYGKTKAHPDCATGTECTDLDMEPNINNLRYGKHPTICCPTDKKTVETCGEPIDVAYNFSLYGDSCDHELWLKFSYLALDKPFLKDWEEKDHVIDRIQRIDNTFFKKLCYVAYDPEIPLYCTPKNTCGCPSFYHPIFRDKGKKFNYVYDDIAKECRGAKGSLCYDPIPGVRVDICKTGLECRNKHCVETRKRSASSILKGRSGFDFLCIFMLLSFLS